MTEKAIKVDCPQFVEEEKWLESKESADAYSRCSALAIGDFTKEIVENTEDYKEAFLKDYTFYKHCMLLMTNRSIGVRDLLKIIYDLCMEKRKISNQLLSYVEKYGEIKI